MMSNLSTVCLAFLFVTFILPKAEGCQDCSTSAEMNGEVFEGKNLLLTSSLPKHNVTSLSDHRISASDVQPKFASKYNESRSIHVLTGQAIPSGGGGSDDAVYYASHSSSPRKPYDAYFGLIATVDVFGYDLRLGQMSKFTIWVENMGDGSKGSYNSIQVGWMVSPEIYGDSHTHFYTHWTRDGLGNSGCYNMDCPGFQMERGSKIAPGSVIPRVSSAGSSRVTITIKVFKEKSSGNWWVYYGFNNDTPTAVGYYPANIFTGLASKADEIAVGGEARARRSLPSPPMGSGFLPSERAASVSNLQFVDQYGHSTPVTSDLPIIALTPKCYNVSPIVGAKFSYGGPAGCH